MARSRLLFASGIGAAMRTSPEAFFDAVTIIRRMSPELVGVSRFEVQRVAYLACMLGLYGGEPLAEWGYLFIRSDFGAPFSGDLNSAMDVLSQQNLMNTSQGGRFTENFANTGRMNLFMTERLAARERYLIPACDSALYLPASTLAAGIDAEPTSQSAALQDGGRPLLDNSAQNLLYDQIKAVREVVGASSDDLLTPSMLWMTYSARQPISRSNGNSCE